MNLDALPVGENIVLDTNVLVYALQKISGQCQRLLERCAREEIRGIIPLPVLAETIHQLMIYEARDNQWIRGSNPARQLAEQPERVCALSRYESLIRDLMGMNIALDPVDYEDVLSALSIQRQAGLLTNDALLVAVALRLRVSAVASADRSLARARGITLYSPDDLIP
jgi:predicted nucleic acid-binding protein